MPHSSTHTGQFPIGFRRGGSPWQRDLASLIAWAVEHRFAAIDLGADAPAAAPSVLAAGLKVGSADLLRHRDLLSPDKARRDDALAANADHIAVCAALDIRHFFSLLLPEKPDAPRIDNFRLAVAAMGELAGILESHSAHAVIEGWPDRGALGCNPETCRALFKEVPSTAMALNYDPSHLIRMGIDPIRFLDEFADRVRHVHGKDCAILPDARYDIGHEQPGVFTPAHAYGGWSWRYTLPGAGEMRWTEALTILRDRHYTGLICIELEDENFNGATTTEQAGLLRAAGFLAEQ